MVINKEVLLSPLPSNFASENAITALQETELDTSALGLCGWCYFTGHSINTRQRKTVASLNASVEICLEVNAKKTKYLFVPHRQNVSQNHPQRLLINLDRCGNDTN